MARRLKVSVCGDVVHERHLHLDAPLAPERYAHVESSLASLGGAGAFASFVLAALDAEVHLFAPRANDAVGRVYRNAIARRGIRWDRTCGLAATPIFYSLYDRDGNRYIAHDPLPLRSDRSMELPECDLLLLYPCSPDVARALATQASKRRVPMVFAPSHTLFGQQKEFRWLAQLATWTVLNRWEAEEYQFAGLRGMPNAVITDGAVGATMLLDGGKEFVAATTVTSYSDAGTGDVLAALFGALCVGRARPPLRALADAQAGVREFLARSHMPLEHGARLRGLRGATRWE